MIGNLNRFPESVADQQTSVGTAHPDVAEAKGTLRAFFPDAESEIAQAWEWSQGWTVEQRRNFAFVLLGPEVAAILQDEKRKHVALTDEDWRRAAYVSDCWNCLPCQAISRAIQQAHDRVTDVF